MKKQIFQNFINKEIENRPFLEPNRNRRVGTGSLEPEPDHVGTGNTGTVYHHMTQCFNGYLEMMI